MWYQHLAKSENWCSVIFVLELCDDSMVHGYMSELVITVLLIY